MTSYTLAAWFLVDKRLQFHMTTVVAESSGAAITRMYDDVVARYPGSEVAYHTEPTIR